MLYPTLRLRRADGHCRLGANIPSPLPSSRSLWSSVLGKGSRAVHACTVDYTNMLAQSCIPASDRCTRVTGRGWGGIGRTHEITRGRGQSSRGACAQIGVSVSEIWIYRPQASSLEGKSIHVCIQQCTHVYTTVYTRVHKCALSISSLGLACMSISWG